MTPPDQNGPISRPRDDGIIVRDWGIVKSRSMGIEYWIVNDTVTFFQARYQEMPAHLRGKSENTQGPEIKEKVRNAVREYVNDKPCKAKEEL